MAEGEKVSKATVKAVTANSKAEEKPKLGEAVSHQQRNQIILLVVVLLLIAVALYFFTIKPGSQTPTQTEKPPIETEFNTAILEEVRRRNNAQIDINTDGLGKSNPFSAE